MTVAHALKFTLLRETADLYSAYDCSWDRYRSETLRERADPVFTARIHARMLQVRTAVCGTRRPAARIFAATTGIPVAI